MKLDELTSKAMIIGNNVAKGIVYLHSPENFKKASEIKERITQTFGETKIRTDNVKRFGVSNFVPADLWKKGSFEEHDRRYDIFQMNKNQSEIFIPTTIFGLEWMAQNGETLSDYFGSGSVSQNETNRVIEFLDKAVNKGSVNFSDLSLPFDSYTNLLNRLQANEVVTKEVLKTKPLGQISEYQITPKGLNFYETFVQPLHRIIGNDTQKRELLDRWREPVELEKICRGALLDLQYGSAKKNRQNMYGLICENPGIRTNQLSLQTGLHLNTVKLYANQLLDSGAITKNIEKGKSMYFPKVE